jgi:uncharacterized protein (DUF1697 family)
LTRTNVRFWIALFRGINVGGNNMLPMKELAALIEALGGTRVRTYIQSGNVVFGGCGTDAAELTSRIEAAVLKKHGFTPRVLLLMHTQLERAAIANPFRDAEAGPKTLHVAFLAERPKNPDLAGLDAIRQDSEKYALDGKVFYLNTPGGFGKSRLAERYEKLLGVTATARNWNTVMKLREMAKEA